MSSLGDVGAGHTLGRYELLVPIAQGGMAVVWAARMKGMRGFQKLVAVKTMLPELSADPQFEEMFLAEAGLASRIRHPHVCEILDLGEQDGLIYIVMEWIDGEPLSQLARAARQKGGVPILVTLRLCLNAALGLHAAHELKDEAGSLIGLVHRDVSPQNILVTYDGVVKIVDFGVAKATAEADGGHTKDGQLKGKVPFMSPEQALGKQIDRRTDVFALGIVLFQLLANKHPFRGDNDMVTLRQICDKAPAPSLASALPGCPPILNELVAKALEKDAAQRYQSMAELARAIDRAIAELKLAGQPDEDVVAFVKGMLGDRAEKRRTAIREGLKVADERAEQREQVKAQRAAMIAQARASGGTLPPNALTATNLQSLGMPQPLLSIPPPPPPGSLPGLHPPDVPTVAHGRSTLPPSTIGSLGTNGAVVADLTGIGAPPDNKKRLAVVGFALVGALAIGGAIVAFSRGQADEGPGHSPATTPVPSAATPTSSTTKADEPATKPASTQVPSTQATQAASAAPSATQGSTKTSIGGGVTITTKNPTTKGTGTTKTDSLPRVRDPGF